MLQEEIINIPTNGPILEGILVVPKGSNKIVIFAHGSGSSRHSTRNKYVASILQKNNISTLLFDLLTSEEDTVYENRFNIQLLASRLKAVTEWIINQEKYKKFKIGYFGASTGAAAALGASIMIGSNVRAIVSRGGRVDLHKDVIGLIKAPTLLIVGGNDKDVLELNKKTYELLVVEKELKVIEGASHLFEESGKIEKVAEAACVWFVKYLV